MGLLIPAICSASASSRLLRGGERRNPFLSPQQSRCFERRPIVKLVTLALLAIIGAGIAYNAYAGSCTTTCYGSGTYQTCNTRCW